jgi:hypothetical protein
MDLDQPAPFACDLSVIPSNLTEVGSSMRTARTRPATSRSITHLRRSRTGIGSTGGSSSARRVVPVVPVVPVVGSPAPRRRWLAALFGPGIFAIALVCAVGSVAALRGSTHVVPPVPADATFAAQVQVAAPQIQAPGTAPTSPPDSTLSPPVPDTVDADGTLWATDLGMG